ncbi:Uma2 family endonuclease [Halotia branconii]|uniref:Uma2 family endonuclease n=1 Tax=Halotia branconii CENA392 TaxID=1539056 RepID=A0AAJ6NXU3_9CYAN|nr:Uma2 family endonuclease [Halotia branconii]WGV28383.1 Uma2 family endonuclease [Halotia branconii CENA392]
MVRFNSKIDLPSSDELPDCDGLPVDNELQTLVPNFLGLIIAFIWSNRYNWFWGVNMGVYHTTGLNPRVPIVPDAFLSLGVERTKRNQLRKSYVVWEENEVVPSFVLEVVSQTPDGEYHEKINAYAQMGVLYYVIYNPDFWRTDQHQPFEVYRLVNGVYQSQIGEPFWMPEIGLGIGRSVGEHLGLQREWLYWYDQKGNRFSTPEELLNRYRERFGELAENEEVS